MNNITLPTNQMNELYFKSKDEEMAYGIEHFKGQIKEDGLKEMTVFKAEPYKDIGHFWCSEFMLVGENGNGTCGSGCKKYRPRNGKSGCCTHYSTIFYQPTDKTITITNED